MATKSTAKRATGKPGKAVAKPGAVEIVQITVRLLRSDRDKLAHLAIDQRSSIQGLLEGAISKLFKAHGIPE